MRLDFDLTVISYDANVVNVYMNLTNYEAQFDLYGSEWLHFRISICKFKDLNNQL